MEKKLNLDKAREILQLLQEDTITPKQAKELVTLLVKLTEKQKQDLILKNEDFLSKVSQETFTQIQNALIEIKQKAHDNQLEVRQLTNKQKVAYESKMAQLEALIDEFRAFEIPEIDEERIIQEALSRIPEVKEYELLGENVVDSINSLEVTPDNQIDAKHIKNLPQSVNNIVAGAGGRLLSQMNDVDITGLAQDKVLKWDATRNIWVTGTVSGGGGGSTSSVYNEVPSGLVNGINTTYTTSQDFTTNTTRVYLNGLRQKLVSGVDYTESGNSQIIFSVAPAINDIIIVDYEILSITPTNSYLLLQDGTEVLLQDGTEVLLNS